MSSLPSPSPLLSAESSSLALIRTPKMSLMTYLEKTFGIPESKEKLMFCQITSVKDFARALMIDSEAEDTDMNVFKSSTWAVCKEFFGELDGDELEYASHRGGYWDGVHTVREILGHLRDIYE